MNEHVLTALTENCQSFVTDLGQQQTGQLNNQMLFCWQSLLVNSGNKELAIEFTKANPNCTAEEIQKLETFVIEAAEKDIKPTKCTTFGCKEENIEQCHKKTLRNAKGEPSNSPAYFIREENLKKYKTKEDFGNIKYFVFDKITSGDMSAHLDEAFVKAAANLKATDASEFVKLKNELKDMKVKIAAFDDEVDKIYKAVAKEKTVAAMFEIDLPENLKPYSVGLDPLIAYIDENGHIVAMIPTKDGDVCEAQASNFVAHIVEVREFDDGVDVENQFVITGILEGKKNLPTIVVNAKEFRYMKWLLRLWGNVLITSAPKATDIVRETIQRNSKDAPIVKVHYTLGWKNIDDVWYYLYSGGSIGGDNVSVAEINELKGYFFKDYPYSIEECVGFVQKFMDIAPHEITIPILAHIFLSVLIEKLKQEEIEPRFLMWVYGVSGSFKTALMIVAINFFGTFVSPPATFNDTAAALEKKSYLTKDSLLLVDDFHPAASPQEAKSKATVANGLTRRYGDRITRSRSKSNLTLAKDYPPRGNLICTSEDVLVGHSTNSRHMGIEIRRGDINADILTELQNNKEYLACFMVNFIKYVSEYVMNNSAITYKERFLDYRNKSQDSNHHRRFAEAIACLQIGWETLLDFLKHIGHIDETKCQEYFTEGFKIFQELAKRQNELVQNDDMADKFMTALKELLDSKQIVPVNKDLPSTLNKGTVICYMDESYYYFIPQSIYALVSEFLLKKGDLLNISDYMLRKMLLDRKYLIESSDNDGHKTTTKIKVGLATIRVLRFSKSLVDTF